MTEEPKSLTALKEELKQDKLRTFEYLRSVSRLSREDLDNAGYRGKSNAEAVKSILDSECDIIEKKVRAWEKANPDD